MASNSVYNMLFMSPKGNSLDKLTVKKIYFNKKKSRKNLHLHHKTLGKNPKTFFMVLVEAYTLNVFMQTTLTIYN